MAQYNEIRLGDSKSEVSIQIKIAFRTAFFHENPPKSGSVTKYFPYRYFKTAFNSAQLIKKTPLTFWDKARGAFSQNLN